MTLVDRVSSFLNIVLFRRAQLQPQKPSPSLLDSNVHKSVVPPSTSFLPWVQPMCKLTDMAESGAVIKLTMLTVVSGVLQTPSQSQLKALRSLR